LSGTNSFPQTLHFRPSFSCTIPHPLPKQHLTDYILGDRPRSNSQLFQRQILQPGFIAAFYDFLLDASERVFSPVKSLSQL